MKKNYLRMIFVIDESGSMHGTELDVIGGINTYIAQQQSEEAGKVDVSLYKFNDTVTRVFRNRPINKVQAVGSSDYCPNGFTALNDAVGQAIHETDADIAEINESDRPDVVMMIIVTDGKENASTKFSHGALKTLIASHEKLMNWKFIYLGANLTDFDDAIQLGINRMSYTPKEKIGDKFKSISEASLRFRVGRPEDDDDTIMQDLMSDLNENKE